MKIEGVPLVEKHLGFGYESYKIVLEDKNYGRILEKSLTDNSKIYDLQVWGDPGEDEEYFVIIGLQNKCHGKRILKTMANG